MSNEVINELVNFPIRSESNLTDWESIQAKCPTLSDWGIKKLRNGLEDYVKNIVLEPHYICKDHRNLHSHFYSKKFHVSSPYTSRLHFFTKSELDIDDLLCNPDRYRDSYLGYSVIRPVAERCLGRTIIDPIKIGKNIKNNFFCLRTDFKTHISGNQFIVKGYPYISQDTEATVCAHAALWGVCRYLSERYSVYGEVYPFDLIEMTGKIFGRTFPNRGMTYLDYSEILSKFGTHPLIFEIDNPIDLEEVYTYVESGFPVLASLSKSDDSIKHVITLIGHTINYEKDYKPDQDGFIDSSNFLNDYIVVDDNCFPYALFGKKENPNNYWLQFDKQCGREDIKSAVCPLPEKVFLSAGKARKQAICMLKKMLLKHSTSEDWVVRLFVTTNTAFKFRKRQTSLNIGADNKQDKLSYLAANLRLPHFVWVLEAAPLDLYKKGYCMAEIVIDASSGPLDNGLIYARYGNLMSYNETETIFFEVNPTFKQYTHNLGEVA